MTSCLRPQCARPRSVGVHCRKCHARWKVLQHNLGREHTTVIGPPTWPAYDPGMTLVDFLDRLIAGFSGTAPQ